MSVIALKFLLNIKDLKKVVAQTLSSVTSLRLPLLCRCNLLPSPLPPPSVHRVPPPLPWPPAHHHR